MITEADKIDKFFYNAFSVVAVVLVTVVVGTFFGGLGIGIFQLITK